MAANRLHDDTDLALLDDWQRGFPLLSQPYKAIGERYGVDEAATTKRYDALARRGILSRIGAVVRPNTIGASTLAAFAVPPDELDMVAEIVSEEPTVNHNYERENRFNLWFVVAGPSETAVSATLSRLSDRIPYPLLDLRLERPFHLDLGFALRAGVHTRDKTLLSAAPDPSTSAGELEQDRIALAALEDGLPYTARPFEAIANRLGWREDDLLDRIEDLAQRGIVTRFGTVVRHRALGYTANAMAVWDIPDDRVEEIGPLVAMQPRVTLCYRRRRALPDWRYNLYCMIHARSRDDVPPVLEAINTAAGLADAPQTVLFSTRCFKQRGARFSKGRAAA